MDIPDSSENKHAQAMIKLPLEKCTLDITVSSENGREQAMIKNDIVDEVDTEPEHKFEQDKIEQEEEKGTGSNPSSLSNKGTAQFLNPAQQAEAKRLRDDILAKIAAVRLVVGAGVENEQKDIILEGEGCALPNTDPSSTLAESAEEIPAGEAPNTATGAPVSTPAEADEAGAVEADADLEEFPQPITGPLVKEARAKSTSPNRRRTPKAKKKVLTPTELLRKKQAHSIQVVRAANGTRRIKRANSVAHNTSTRYFERPNRVAGLDLPDVSHLPHVQRMAVYQRYVSTVMVVGERRLLKRLKTPEGQKILTIEATKDNKMSSLSLESRILRAKIHLVSNVRSKARIRCWNLIKERERMVVAEQEVLKSSVKAEDSLPGSPVYNIITGNGPPPTGPPPDVPLASRTSPAEQSPGLNLVPRIWRSTSDAPRPTGRLLVTPRSRKNSSPKRMSSTAGFRHWLDDTITDIVNQPQDNHERPATTTTASESKSSFRSNNSSSPIRSPEQNLVNQPSIQRRMTLMVDFARLKEGRALKKKMGHEKKYKFPRFIWLSDDETTIFWAKGTSKVGRPKNMSLLSYRSVRGQLPGKMTRKDTKSLKENYCFSLISSNNRETLDLQFPAGTELWEQHILGEREIWIKSLQCAIAKAKAPVVETEAAWKSESAHAEVIEVMDESSAEDNLAKQRAKVLGVVRGFMEREREYVKQLDYCTQQYITRLKMRDTNWKEELMRHSDMKPLITSFEALASQTSQLFEDICTESQDTDGVMICLLFSLNYGPMLSQFPQYQEMYLRAGKKLQSLANNPDFEKFQNKVQHESNAQMPMLVYFGLPLRQIHEYADTVKQLHDLTPDTDPDYEHQRRALQQLNETEAQMATVTRQIMAMTRLAKIESRFMDDVKLVMKGRHLVHEGKLTKLSRKAKRNYHFHLFNDILMYSSVKGVKFQLHRAMQLHTCVVHSHDEASEGRAPKRTFSRKSSRKLSNIFEIASAEKTFQVIALNAADKERWVRLLQQSIEEVVEKHSRRKEELSLAPNWQQDNTAPDCKLCHVKFNFVVRRHHCRKCGCLCCDRCSRARLQLTNISQAGAVRVCDACKKGVAIMSKRKFGVRVDLKSCHFLAPKRGPARRRTCRHPYVIIQLQQVHRQTWRSSTIRNTINPVWSNTTGKASSTAVFTVDQLSSAQLTMQVWDEKKMKSPCFLGQCDIDLESADVQERHTRADRTPTCITITEYTKKLKPRALVHIPFDLQDFNDQSTVSGDVRFRIRITKPEAVQNNELTPAEMVDLCGEYQRNLASYPSRIGVAACNSLIRLAKAGLIASFDGQFSTVLANEGGALLDVVADYKAEPSSATSSAETKTSDRPRVHVLTILEFIEETLGVQSRPDAGLITRLRALEEHVGSTGLGSLQARLIAVYAALFRFDQTVFLLREGENCVGLELKGSTWHGIDTRGFYGHFPTNVVHRDPAEEERGEQRQRLTTIEREVRAVQADVFQHGSSPRSAQQRRWLELDKLTRDSLSVKMDRLTERQRVIHELLQTEKDYVEKLHALERLYADPLMQSRDHGVLRAGESGSIKSIRSHSQKKNSTAHSVGSSAAILQRASKRGPALSPGQSKKMRKLLNDADLQVLLNSIKHILNINTAFLKALAIAVADWKGPVLIGKTLTTFTPHFTQYGVFASAHERALQVMSAKLFQDFTLQQQNAEDGVGSFRSLLISPVQRLPRYRLLLESCLKKTDQSHSDCTDLRVALDKVKEACAEVNEIVRRRENVEHMLDLRERLVGLPNGFTLMQLQRKFIREGHLQMVNIKNRTISQYLILFSDVLVRADTVMNTSINRNT